MKAATVILAGVLACAAAQAQEADHQLKPGTGRDAVEANCVVCHSLDYISMNGSFLSSATWHAEVTKMRTTFGAPIDDQTAASIEAYLNANYGLQSGR